MNVDPDEFAAGLPTEEPLRASLALLQVGILTLDASGHVVLAEGGLIGTPSFERYALIGRVLAEVPSLEWLKDAAGEALLGHDTSARSENGMALEATFRPVSGGNGSVAWVVCLLQPFPLHGVLAAAELESRARAEFEELMALTDGVFWEADPHTLQFLHVSKKAERLLGLPRSAWLQPRFWEERLHPEDRERTVATCRAAVLENQPHQLEYRLLTHDGRTVWIRDFVAAASTPEGRATRLRGVMLNTSRFKSTHGALQRSISLLNATLQASGEGIVVLDRDGRIETFNQRFLDLWRMPRKFIATAKSEDLGRWMVRFLLHPEAMLAQSEIFLGHQNRERRDILKLKDGRVFERHYRPQRLSLEIVGQVWSFRDITHQARLEMERQRLLVDEQRARELAESAGRRSDLLSEVGPKLAEALDFETAAETIVRVAIPKFADACAAFILREGELQTVTVAHRDPRLEPALLRLFQNYPPDPSGQTGMGQVMQTGERFFLDRVSDEFLQALARTPEHLQWLRDIRMKSYIAVPLAIHHRTLGILAFAIIDSNRRFERKDLELAEELGRRCATALDHALLFDETRRAIQIRDDFLAIASHELRTPLTPLKLSLQALEARLKTGRGNDPERLLHHAQRTAERLSALVADLLDVAQLEAGKLVLHTELFLLADAVREVVHDFRQVSPKHELLFEEPAEPQLVNADRARIEQVVGNLLDNAIKYSPEGGPIRLSLRPRGSDALLAISDPGIGIDRDQQAQLFTRFARTRGASRGGFSGMGLGLYICRTILERHGGRIWFESQKGKGSTFYVTLPALPSAHPYVGDKAEQTR